MKIKPQTTIIIAASIVIAGIAITSVTGLWATQSTKIPQKLKEEQYSGQYDPSDIRGSYTFLDISNIFDIPLADLSGAFIVDENKAAAFQCKDLEVIFSQTTNEIGTESVRMFVAFYKGLPYELTSDTYLPENAASILENKSAITADQLAYLENHTVIIPSSRS